LWTIRYSGGDEMNSFSEDIFCYPVKMECPYCYHSGPIQIYPELSGWTGRKLILDGKIFVYRCRTCHRSFAVNYHLIYTDEAHGFFLENIPEEQTDTEPMEREGVFSFCRYTEEISRLQEKLLIFSHGRDDRVIEVLKIRVSQRTGKGPFHYSGSLKDGTIILQNSTAAFRTEVYVPSWEYETVLRLSKLDDLRAGKETWVDEAYGRALLARIRKKSGYPFIT